MRLKIMGLCVVAVFAITAVAASAASAATTLTMKTAKGALTSGSEVKFSSSNLVTVTSAGNLECSSNILTGTVGSNGATKDKATITEEQSTGTGEKTPGACHTTTALGEAVIVSTGFSWPAEFGSNGKVTIKGTKKVTFTSTFPQAGGAKCTFESAKVAATFTAKKPAKGKSETGPLNLATSNQLFKLNKKISNVACPVSGKLTGTFAPTSAGETIEAEFKS